MFYVIGTESCDSFQVRLSCSIRFHGVQIEVVRGNYLFSYTYNKGSNSTWSLELISA